MSRTPAERARSLRARRAAHTSWANTTDRAARTAPGAEGLLRRFERQLDPHEQLPPQVRRARAVHARTAHMLALAERSAAARRAAANTKAAATDGPATADHTARITTPDEALDLDQALAADADSTGTEYLGG